MAKKFGWSDRWFGPAIYLVTPFLAEPHKRAAVNDGAVKVEAIDDPAPARLRVAGSDVAPVTGPACAAAITG